MTVLAIDYGTKRIGIAKWNSEVDVILPYGVLNNIEQVIDLVNKEDIDKIVVGMPFSAEEKEVKNRNIKRVNEFINKLKEKTRIKVDSYDERFSSQQADRMKGSGVSRDEKSAMIILQSYLDSSNLS